MISLINENFDAFFEKVKSSLSDGSFAKLTMAKTIGNTDLKNIYIRPIIEESILKLELKYKYQTEEIIEIYAVNETREILKNYLFNPFLTALLFTTEFDLTYKLNKKRAVNITEQFPSFTHASTVLSDYLQSNIK